MPFPVQISYRDVPHSQQLEELIRAEAARLESIFKRIVNGRVLIERVHHRAPFHARIELSVPGEELYVNGSETHDTWGDPQLAVREAFKKAKRQLLDYVGRRKA